MFNCCSSVPSGAPWFLSHKTVCQCLIYLLCAIYYLLFYVHHIPSYLSHLQNKCSPSSFSLSSSGSFSVSPIIFVAYLSTPSVPAVSF